jgi:hypothetical protein
MQVGDLVRVKNTTTGDPQNMVRLYRERVPLLVLSCSLFGLSRMTLVLDTTSTKFPRLQIEDYRLEVVSTGWQGQKGG